jgi:hypothetical protein
MRKSTTKYKKISPKNQGSKARVGAQAEDAEDAKAPWDRFTPEPGKTRPDQRG